MVKRLRCRRPRFEPWVGKIPWRRKWPSTLGLLPGKSHGQRSLVGYSPWGRKESDTTERLHFHSSCKDLNFSFQNTSVDWNNQQLTKSKPPIVICMELSVYEVLHTSGWPVLLPGEETHCHPPRAVPEDTGRRSDGPEVRLHEVS